MLVTRYGLMPSPEDKRDFTRLPVGASLPIGLPSSANLTYNGWLPAVEDQGPDNDCVAGATIYGRSAMRYRHTGEVRNFSYHWFWYQLRKREGSLGQNIGTYPRDAMKVARLQGFCPDELMPQSQGDYNETPPNGTDQAAFPFRTTRYIRCFDLNAIKLELALSNFVLLAINVNQYFESAGNNGVIDWNGDTNWLGGHAIWPYAYQDDPNYPGGGYLKIRNQWSAYWGLQGDALLTYNLINSPVFMESWSEE